MNIVFLDFDGVIATQDSYARAKVKYGTDHTGFAPAFHLLDSDLVTIVDEICKRTNSSIVLSTTWRELHPFDTIVHMLQYHGLTAPIIGKTPSVGSRGQDISHWLSSQRSTETLTNFIILDDDIDIKRFHYNNRWIQTYFSGPKQGIQQEHIAIAESLMNKPIFE